VSFTAILLHLVRRAAGSRAFSTSTAPSIAAPPVGRSIYAATRATDGARPSTQALLAAVQEAAAALLHR